MATPLNRRQFNSAAACLIATSPVLGLAQVPKKAGTIVKYGKAVTYRSRHSCTIQRNGSSLEHLEVWLPVPSSWSEQLISKVSISPQIEPVPAKNGETRVAHWIAKTADVRLEPIRDSHESVDFLQVGAGWWKGRDSPSVKFEFVGSKIKS